ncbi:MAG: aminotransferase class I/II-fold pyridoxal phosphate-dependent enzyme, partial [Woeseiaceae bacterium]
MSISDLARPEIRALRPYAPARQLDGSIRMNANESPWTDDDRVSPSLNRYPPVRPWALRDRLAGIYGVDAGRLLVTRGSSEAIDLLIRVFCRPGVDNVLLAPPTFGMYRVYAEIQGAGIRAVPMHSGEDFVFDVAGLLRAVDANTRLLFLCSPNNPTGNALGAGQLEALLEAAIGRFLVVIDEA